ncbi:MAG: PAS domain-containing protein [Janthinobacterium lividum]
MYAGPKEGEELVDLALEHLNPVAQQWLGLPKFAPGTLRTLLPHKTDLLDFCRTTFCGGEVGEYELRYARLGWRVVAQRQGEQLVALLTELPPAEWPAQKPSARWPLGGPTLDQVFLQTAMAVCVLHGPTHVLQSFNPAYQQLLPGRRVVAGRPVAEQLPPPLAEGLRRLLDHVYTTGETYAGFEKSLTIGPPGCPATTTYLNLTIQPHLEDGQVVGLAVLAHDVTQHVLARQHLHQRKLHKRLQATNEALLAHNQRLAYSQQQVQELNQELEARVTAGIAAAQQARAEAEYQRQRLERSFQQAPLAICLLVGSELVYELVNSAYQQRFPGRQLVGRPLLQALPELAAHPTASQLRRVYETGHTHEGHEVMLRVARPDTGQLEDAYFNCVYQARFNEQGDIDGVLLFALDVTAQRQAQQRTKELQTQVLQAAQRRVQERDAFYQVFAQTQAAVAFMRGPQYEFEYLNEAFEQLFLGRTLQHISLTDALPEAQQFIPFLNQVYRTGMPYVGKEIALTMQSANGLPLLKYFNLTCQPYREREMVVGISVFAYEVTEQVRARRQLGEMNDALRATNAQLTRTNTDLDNFIYTASHDLKAPIGNIESLLLLLRQELPAEARKAGLVPKVLGMMQNAIERFQLTIAQLTDLSHLQQAYTERPEAVDVAAAIEAVRLDLAAEFEATGGQLFVDLMDCPTLSLAPQHLRSVVYNLVSNALKYCHPDRPPQVHLRCAAQGSEAFLVVQDNGLGLNEAQQQKVFGLFRRLHAHVEGTGVGLYMVKRIVENAGGTITVQSEPGVGATFTVMLPN